MREGYDHLRITRLTQQIEKLAVKSRLVYFLTSAYYRMLIRREANLANINEHDRVLCIGGGICPYTAILLHQYTKAHVTVIDNNRICVDKANGFVKKLGLDQIKIALNDGQCVGYQEFTVIHLAMQISPKEIVINEIMKKAREGTRILVRKPKKGVQHLYCTLSQNEGDSSECIRHGFLSNVDHTSVCVVGKRAAGILT